MRPDPACWSTMPAMTTAIDSEDVTVDYWDDRMAVNLRHQFFAAQAVRPQMRERGGGSIINFGSITWMVGDGDMPGLCHRQGRHRRPDAGLARELGPDNIRVNCVLPGWVMTERQIAPVADAGRRAPDRRSANA